MYRQRVCERRCFEIDVAASVEVTSYHAVDEPVSRAVGLDPKLYAPLRGGRRNPSTAGRPVGIQVESVTDHEGFIVLHSSASPLDTETLRAGNEVGDLEAGAEPAVLPAGRSGRVFEMHGPVCQTPVAIKGASTI